MQKTIGFSFLAGLMTILALVFGLSYQLSYSVSPERGSGALGLTLSYIIRVFNIDPNTFRNGAANTKLL
jgi:hypothetical protein